MQNIVTVKELANLLKLTEATIYKLVSSGELPGFKIGDSWRFDIEEVLKRIQELTAQREMGKNQTCFIIQIRPYRIDVIQQIIGVFTEHE